MKTPSDVITTKGRRRNINLLVTLQPNRRTFQPLLDMVPKNEDELRRFPKTLIFVDSVMDARRIAIALRERFQSVFPNGTNSLTLLRTYYSSIDDEKKERTINLLRNGKAILSICTDAMSLGVDISNIERVIQW